MAAITVCSKSKWQLALLASAKVLTLQVSKNLTA